MEYPADGQLIISIFTTKWGHYSIAKAVEDNLSNHPKYKVFLNVIKMEKLSEKSYLFFYRLFPPLFKIPYKAAEQEEIAAVVKKFLNRKYEKKVKELIEKQKPNVVINTYFAFNWAIEKLSDRNKFLYINIVHDPRSINKLLVSHVGHNFVFDNKAKKLSKSFGIEKKKVIISGWFVRKEYRKDYASEKTRGKLEIPKGDFTIVVIGGSSGTYGMLKVLPALIRPSRRLTVIFICGESKTLYKSIKVFSEAFSSKNLNIVPMGFKNNLYKYMGAADLVVGKAGPNLLFETVASRTPFLAVSHISGQESGNLEIIKKYKLGYVEENHVNVIKLLRKIIKNPKILKRFQKPLERMANYNNQAPDILQKFIEEKTNKL